MCMCVCVCVYIYICIYVCMYVCVYVYIYIYIKGHVQSRHVQQDPPLGILVFSIVFDSCCLDLFGCFGFFGFPYGF